MSYRTPPPPRRPAPRVTVGLIANLAGLALIAACVAGLVVIAFHVHPDLGWAVLCVGGLVLGWRLISVSDDEVT